ncbi:MAG: nucleotidyltransferase family protein, partial [Spirochaetota bacterium]
MDFAKVLGRLLSDFEREKITYALIGGFAMGALGIVRATMDLDFLVKKDDLKAVHEIMNSHGYNLLYKSENVSQY